MIKIGNVVLGKVPTIAVTLTDTEDLPSIQRAKRQGARVLEVRIDRFKRMEPDLVKRRLLSLRRLGMPVIATIRSPKEGGGRRLSDEKRLELFKKVLPSIDAIDVELGSSRLSKVLVPLAHRKRKQVVLSYHNFHSTPSDRAMMKMIQKAKRQKADIVKIAVTPKSHSDVSRLLLFTHRYRDKHLISIAMGRLGASSRILGPLFGSLLTYSFLGRAQAPGQLPLKRLLRLRRRFSRCHVARGTWHP